MEQSESAGKYFAVMINERSGSDHHSKRRVLLSITNSDQKTEQPNPNHRWDRLPSVVMDEIFSHLTYKDRMNSAVVCSNWRLAFLHPRYWKKIKFTLSNSEKISMAINIAKRFGRSVEYVTVECHTSCSGFDLNQLLEQLGENRFLRQLLIEPTLATAMDKSIINPIFRSIQHIIQSSKKLEVFTLGFIEELAAFSDIFVDMLAHHGRHLIQLGLASVKNGQEIRQQAKFCRFTFEQFESIEYLSIDYDNLNDAVLTSLTSGTLKRLVVHVHETSKDHPGTSDVAWQAFTEKNKHCELHLIFVRAYEIINVAHEIILKPHMPLTHFKALFCERSNIHLLRQLVTWYRQTLESIIWVDSINGHELRRFADDLGHHEHHVVCESFYRCPNFKEVIYVGQVRQIKYPDEPILFICPVPRGGIMHCQYAARRGSDCLLDVSYARNSIQRFLDRYPAWQEFYKIVYDVLDKNSEELMLLPLLLRDTK